MKLLVVAGFMLKVTFREEGVDWNLRNGVFDKSKAVTFCEEGVDWNEYEPFNANRKVTSPSGVV